MPQLMDSDDHECVNDTWQVAQEGEHLNEAQARH
jgi:hypothetical protein